MSPGDTTVSVHRICVALPAWAALAKRYGKRLTYMGAGYLYAAVALTWLLASSAELPWITNIRIFI